MILIVNTYFMTMTMTMIKYKEYNEYICLVFIFTQLIPYHQLEVLEFYSIHSMIQDSSLH